MSLEDCLYYNELNEYSFAIDYLDMLEYTIDAYMCGKLSNNLSNGADTIKPEMIDFDAIRWFKGEISTQELYCSYREFFVRAN